MTAPKLKRKVQQNNEDADSNKSSCKSLSKKHGKTDGNTFSDILPEKKSRGKLRGN